MRILRGPLFWIVVVAVLLRALAFSESFARMEQLGLEVYDEYGGIANHIVEGRGFSYAWFGDLRPTSIHTPVYPYLLAGVFHLTESSDARLWIVLLLSLGFSVAVLVGVHRVVSHLFGRTQGLAAAVVLALLPTQIYYGGSPLPTALFQACLFLTFLGALWCAREFGPRRALVFGATGGVCALAYSFVVVLFPLLLVWIVLSRRPTPRRVGNAALAVVSMVLVFMPWTLRNHDVHGHWILLRSQSGTNLWWGNHERSTGGPVDLDGYHLGSFPPEIESTLRGFQNEVDGDRHLGALARKSIAENPGRAIRMWFRKQAMFWWFPSPEHGGLDPSSPGEFAVMVGRAGLLLASILGASLVWSSGRRWFLLLVAGVPLTLASVLSVFHTGRIRYFAPVEPLLAILAGVAIAWAVHRLTARGADRSGTTRGIL